MKDNSYGGSINPICSDTSKGEIDITPAIVSPIDPRKKKPGVVSFYPTMTDPNEAFATEYQVLKAMKDKKYNMYYFHLTRIDELKSTTNLDEKAKVEPLYSFRDDKTGELYMYPKEMEIILELRSDHTSYWKFNILSKEKGISLFKDGYYIPVSFTEMLCDY